MASSPRLKGLTKLTLSDEIGAEGAAAVAQSPHLSTAAKFSALVSANYHRLADQVQRTGQAQGGGHPGPA